jgi:hypothetical protein
MAVIYGGICFITLATGVNFTNILFATFVPKSFRQKITNPYCERIKAAQKSFAKKAARKILVKLTPWTIFTTLLFLPNLQIRTIS